MASLIIAAIAYALIILAAGSIGAGAIIILVKLIISAIKPNK